MMPRGKCDGKKYVLVSVRGKICVCKCEGKKIVFVSVGGKNYVCKCEGKKVRVCKCEGRSNSVFVSLCFVDLICFDFFINRVYIFFIFSLLPYFLYFFVRFLL